MHDGSQDKTSGREHSRGRSDLTMGEVKGSSGTLLAVSRRILLQPRPNCQVLESLNRDFRVRFNSLVKFATTGCPLPATLLLGLWPSALFPRALSEKGGAYFGPSSVATRPCESSIPLFSRAHRIPSTRPEHSAPANRLTFSHPLRTSFCGHFPHAEVQCPSSATKGSRAKVVE
jgi:hypothetical protein